MKKLTSILIVMLLTHVAMGQKAPRTKTVADVCDMSLFSYTIKPSVKSKIGVSIRWVRPQVAGIRNAAATGNTGEINEYLNNTTADLEHLIKSLFFIPFNKNGAGHYPILFLGWTLNFEIIFYLYLVDHDLIFEFVFWFLLK